VQPLRPHEHWHVDVSYLNIVAPSTTSARSSTAPAAPSSTGTSREQMTEADIEQIIQKAKECHPGVTPRIITDNGPQFLAKDFKEFIRISGMTHVKTSPYYPQSNGKIERFHRTLKHDAVRKQTPLFKADSDRVVGGFILRYNTVRLHSAIGYVTQHDVLAGRRDAIHAERDRKLEEARERRRLARQTTRTIPTPPLNPVLQNP
jgi:putative transposase